MGKNLTKNNKKSTFLEKKEKTLLSLNEVEHFLKNYKKFSNYIKLYKIIK